MSCLKSCVVRVYPDITLKTLRSELSVLLGSERSIDKFSFLKCVGRSLALVSAAGHEVEFFYSLLLWHTVERGNNVDSLMNTMTNQTATVTRVCFHWWAHSFFCYNSNNGQNLSHNRLKANRRGISKWKPSPHHMYVKLKLLHVYM